MLLSLIEIRTNIIKLKGATNLMTTVYKGKDSAQLVVKTTTTLNEILLANFVRKKATMPNNVIL